MNNLFKLWIKQFLGFQKKDRNAILILLGFIILLIFFRISLELFPDKKPDYDYSEMERFLVALEGKKTAGTDHQMLFAFDPNLISARELDSLAIPEFVKRNILSYRNAGGKFKSNQDLRKIYGMNDSIFAALDRFIVIAESKTEYSATNKISVLNTEPVNSESGKEAFQIEPGIRDDASTARKATGFTDLNLADSVELVRLKGIGPVYASRILKYRNLLGGFYATEQLLEVYNFSEETFREIENTLITDTSRLNLIRINFAEFSELLRHPYLNEEQVKKIVSYREREGAFRSVMQIYEQNLLDSVSFIRIRPYLTCR